MSVFGKLLLREDPYFISDYFTSICKENNYDMNREHLLYEIVRKIETECRHFAEAMDYCKGKYRVNSLVYIPGERITVTEIYLDMDERNRAELGLCQTRLDMA